MQKGVNIRVLCNVLCEMKEMTFMEVIKDFKHFIEKNKDKLYATAEDANDITIDDEWMQDDQWDEVYIQEEKKMKKYNLGEVWWTQFPFQEVDVSKRRPAIIIDENTIAVLTMMVTSKNKKNPYNIKIDDWREAGLAKESWTRIDRVVRMDEWRMEKKIGDLSKRDLLKVTQLFTEYLTGAYHEFSLLAIRNSKDEYLQVYDERWKCWLFPYYRTEDSNKEKVDKYASDLLNMKVTTSYIANAPHCKYSESDQTYKMYKHMLYFFSLSEIPQYMDSNIFEINNKKYTWKSIQELESDSNVMKKNDDIIAFVKTKCKQYII